MGNAEYMGSRRLAADVRSCLPLSLHIEHRLIVQREINMMKQLVLMAVMAMMVVNTRASPFVLIDPATGRAVQQARPYWHWSNQAMQQEPQKNDSQDDNEVDGEEDVSSQQSEQLVERAFVQPYTPYVHPQEPTRSEYISETGTPLYKLRRRNPYGRK